MLCNHPDKKWEIVIIESRYAAPTPEGIEFNLRYLRAAIRDCIVNYHETPYASHGLLTQPGVLMDEEPSERKEGISAGHAFIAIASKTVVYTDLGISSGMSDGIAVARYLGKRIESRELPPCKYCNCPYRNHKGECGECVVCDPANICLGYVLPVGS